MNVIHSICPHRSSMQASKKLIYPAADRNKDPILSVIRQYIRRGPDQIFLEIASGTGQHVSHFAPHFPQVTFYPSEYEPTLLESITAHTQGLSNVEKPSVIDITTDFRTWNGKSGVFKENNFDYIYSANMIHISPYPCTEGLFQNAGKLLKSDGFLFTYGPYAIDGKITPESNVNFDKSLKSQNPEWGLRDVNDLKNLAKENKIDFIDIVDMPANNKTIVWKKM